MSRGVAEVSHSLAVVDPAALRELDLREQRSGHMASHPGFGLHHMLDPDGAAPLSGERLFGLPSMAAVGEALGGEFARYRGAQQPSALQTGSGNPAQGEIRLFDPAQLLSPATRFILAGIVNRMDRGYAAADRCGEIRLIYRPLHRGADDARLRRLPMTLNLVLRASGDGALPCRELARRWLAAGELRERGTDLALRLLAPDGPLAVLGRASIDRLELNLQIAHLPQPPPALPRIDYLLRAFRYDPAQQRFQDMPLENQIDRDRLRADPALGRDFSRWLLQPDNLAAFDRGTALIPPRFLARSVVAAAPAAFARDDRRPAAGLAGPLSRDPLFTDADIAAALQRAADAGVTLHNIRSPAGFERRLNDLTCSGCHQTRAIGGFHFPGVDWSENAARRPVAAPGSPHFLADQPRRRAIVEALRDGERPDYARGFADRPQERGGAGAAGSADDGGWGAHCGRAGADGLADPSFRGWTCAQGLSCQPAPGGADGPVGMCFIGSR